VSSARALLGRAARLVRRLLGTLELVRRALAAARRHRLDPLERAELVAQTARAFCRVHDLEVEMAGALPPGPKVVVMNHLGYIDPVVLAARQPLTAIAKSEVAAWPIVGTMGAELGIMFVERGSAHSGFRVLRRVLRALAAGATVLNFPEGTTSDGKDVLPFHRGIFGAARIAGVPVVPVRLCFDDPSLVWVGDAPFVPHYLELASRRGARVRLEVLAALDPSAFARAEDLAEAARGALRGRASERAPLAS
jgi:1-acyl-sn-glycerol-3-phosphate acyltransferase